MRPTFSTASNFPPVFTLFYCFIVLLFVFLDNSMVLQGECGQHSAQLASFAGYTLENRQRIAPGLWGYAPGGAPLSTCMYPPPHMTCMYPPDHMDCEGTHQEVLHFRLAWNFSSFLIWHACILLLIWHACILLLIWHACILLFIWHRCSTLDLPGISHHSGIYIYIHTHTYIHIYICIHIIYIYISSWAPKLYAVFEMYIYMYMCIYKYIIYKYINILYIRCSTFDLAGISRPSGIFCWPLSRANWSFRQMWCSSWALGALGGGGTLGKKRYLLKSSLDSGFV